MSFASNRRHARVSALAGLVALTLMSACVQEQDHLVVDRAVWFDDAEECMMDASGDGLLGMTADVAPLGARIGLGFVVTNNQSPNENSNTGVDDSQIEVESVEVNLSFSGGAVAGGSYEVTVPNNSLRGGDSVPFLVQVPSEVVDSIRAGMSPGVIEVLEMSVVFKGRKYGNSGGSKLGEVKSREFSFPIDICLNCMPCAACGFPQPAGDCQLGGGGDTTDTGG